MVVDLAVGAAVLVEDKGNWLVDTCACLPAVDMAHASVVADHEARAERDLEILVAADRGLMVVVAVAAIVM